jgi:hypothetical protein
MKRRKQMRNVLVRVYDSGGRPVSNARIGIEVHQFLAGGVLPYKYTNSNGEAEFDMDIDQSAEITIYVNGTEKVRRGSIQGLYRIEL